MGCPQSRLTPGGKGEVQEQKWKEYLRSREEIASKRKQLPTLSNVTEDPAKEGKSKCLFYLTVRRLVTFARTASME